MQTLSKRAALDWVGAHEWRKGQAYVRGLTGLTAQPDGEQLILQASAHGQEKYTVRVTLQGERVRQARCSCPVGEDDGSCKHVAAVLTRFVDSPESFSEIRSLDSVLNALDADALRATIRLMLEREPDLLSLVLTRPARGKGKKGQSNLVSRLRDAFSLVDYDPELDWVGEGPDLRAFTPLVKEVTDQIERVDELDAQAQTDLLAACLALLEGCADINDDDYDLGLSDLIAPARTGLLRLLQEPLDQRLREQALDGLEEAIAELGWRRSEIETENQLELFADLPDTERQQLLTFVRSLLPEANEYRRRRLSTLLYLLTAEENLSFDEELELARATGNQENVVKVLFKHGRSAEAIRELSAGRKGLAPQQVEHLFEEHDMLPQLEEYAQQHLHIFGSRAWLFGRYRDTGRTAQAHALALDAVLHGTGEHRFYLSSFLQSDPDWLSELKAISPDWPSDRAKYVQQLWKKTGMTDALLAFLLDENLLIEAQKLVGSRRSISPELLTTLALRLSAEEAKPLLLRVVLSHAAGRGRTHYAAAAAALAQAIPLIGQDEAQAIARMLVRDFPTLRALKDELQKAKLL